MKSGTKILLGLAAAGGLAYYFLRSKVEAAPLPPLSTDVEIMTISLRQ